MEVKIHTANINFPKRFENGKQVVGDINVYANGLDSLGEVPIVSGKDFSNQLKKILGEAVNKNEIDYVCGQVSNVVRNRGPEHCNFNTSGNKSDLFIPVRFFE